jgi:lantibiotic biosynthesis protein
MNNCLINDTGLNNKITSRINAIAKCLLNYKDKNENISLFEGKAGIVLFWAYFLEYSGNIKLEKTLSSLIYDVFQGIRLGSKSPAFGNGLAGIGWVIEHLKQSGFIDIDTDSLFGSFDDFLYPFMLKYMQRGEYDYLHGSLGIGLYYLNRSSNPKTQLYITRLVDELEKGGKCFPDSIAWESEISNETNARGYNLGMSHGIASIISVLSLFYKANVQCEKTNLLVKRSVNFLLQSKQENKLPGSCYPRWINKNGYPVGNLGRLSWCYNDLGISMALWNAGKIFNNDLWKQEAVATLLNTTKTTDLVKAGVNDAGLCHGAAGIAHIYNRAFKYTGVEKFKESAVYWFEQSLKMAVFEDGLAGYKTFASSKYGGMYNNYGFLEGIAGIGLAMISAVSEIVPDWDSALLLS